VGWQSPENGFVSVHKGSPETVHQLIRALQDGGESTQHRWSPN
jgi:hypothetical protein